MSNNYKGVDTLSDVFVIGLLKDKAQQVKTASNKKSLNKTIKVASIQQLEVRGFKSLGTGIYRDAKHHLWQVEKTNDGFNLVRSAGEEDVENNLEESTLLTASSTKIAEPSYGGDIRQYQQAISGQPIDFGGKVYRFINRLNYRDLVKGKVVGNVYKSTNVGANVYEILGYSGMDVKYGEGGVKYSSIQEVFQEFGVSSLKTLYEKTDELAHQQYGKDWYGHGIYMWVKDLEDGSEGGWFYIYNNKWARGSGAETLTWFEVEEEGNRTSLKTSKNKRAFLKNQTIENKDNQRSATVTKNVKDEKKTVNKDYDALEGRYCESCGEYLFAVTDEEWEYEDKYCNECKNASRHASLSEKVNGGDIVKDTRTGLKYEFVVSSGDIYTLVPIDEGTILDIHIDDFNSFFNSGKSKASKSKKAGKELHITELIKNENGIIAVVAGDLEYIEKFKEYIDARLFPRMFHTIVSNIEIENSSLLVYFYPRVEDLDKAKNLLQGMIYYILPKQ